MKGFTKERNENLIWLGVGIVALYFIVKKLNEKSEKNPEEKVGAWGQQCSCQGQYAGTCINWFGIGDCCERMCRKKIHDKVG